MVARGQVEFTHIAIEIPSDGASNEWLESVSDGEYDNL